MTASRRRTITTTLGAAVGAVLFTYAVRTVGVDALADGMRRVGWGLILILALAGVRFAVRAQCWRLCLPPGVPLDYPHAFGAFVAGDAVGQVTPLGLLASEPMKVLLTRHHLATIDSVASLALENILYGVSVIAMLGLGLALLLATIAVPDAIWWIAIASLVATTMTVAGAVALVRAPRLLRVRGELSRFAADHPGRLARVFSLQVLFHVLAVIETYVTLRWLIGAGATPPQAIILETVNRFTTVVFKFVPFRFGVDEAASGTIAPLLAVTATAGVTLAVVRRARVLFWSAIGLLIVAAHPAHRSS